MKFLVFAALLSTSSAFVTQVRYVDIKFERLLEIEELLFLFRSKGVDIHRLVHIIRVERNEQGHANQYNIIVLFNT
jgi:hypothetical protein